MGLLSPLLRHVESLRTVDHHVLWAHLADHAEVGLWVNEVRRSPHLHGRPVLLATKANEVQARTLAVEADETYLGPSGHTFVNDKGWQMKRGVGDKMKIVTLVERGGRARSVKVDEVTADSVQAIVTKTASKDSVLMTDESNVYRGVGKRMKRHFTVNHGKGEYAKGFVTTNTVEGYFSIFKRGMKGTYQHCSEHNLQRYLNEFDFRYSNRSALGVEDAERAEIALKGIEGKRLTYRGTRRGAAAA